MPLSEAEQRCVRLVCDYLDQTRGGQWRPEAKAPLQDRVKVSGVPNPLVPEDVVTDGRKRAAVEVKGIHGDSEFIGYLSNLKSLRKSLAPPGGGYFTLSPSIDFHVPIDKKLHKSLKREIARVSPGLRPGETAPVRVHRRARVSLIRSDGQGNIYCSHNVTGHEVQRLSSRLTGTYYLVDADQREHAFTTDAAREAFAQQIEQACAAVAANRPGNLEWFEEWELHRLDDDSDAACDGDASTAEWQSEWQPAVATEGGDETEPEPQGVWIICATEARDAPDAVEEAVVGMIDKGIEKFAAQRWGDLHVLVLDNSWSLTSLDRIRAVLGDFGGTELTPLYLLLYVQEETLTPLWARPS